MADTLSLRIHLSSAEAGRKLREINKLLRDNEKATKSLQQSMTGIGSGIETTKIKGLVTETDKAADSTKKLGSKWQELQKRIKDAEKVGRGMGRTFVSGMGQASAMAMSLTRNLVSLGAAMTGIAGTKVIGDYMGFSKSAGQLNAIVKGGLTEDGYSREQAGKTGRLLENYMVGATAGTGLSNAELIASAQSLASTIQFDPTDGGKYTAGTKEYTNNLRAMADVMQRTGQFAASMNTDLSVMTEGMIKYASTFGYDIKSMDDVVRIQDKFNALLNTSQGGLERMIPQISKFAQEFKLLGVSENDQLALFSTLTNVFDPEEAGTRTLAIANWLNANAKKLKSMSKTMGPEIGKEFYDALFTPEGASKSMEESIMGVMGIMDKLDSDLQRAMLGGVTFSEIRQSSGVKSLNTLWDLFEKTKKEMGQDKGLSAGSIEAMMSTTGAKMDLFFTSIGNSAQAVFGSAMDILFNLGDPSKFNFDDFEKALENVGAKLNHYLGEGASAPIRGLINMIEWMNDNRDTLKRVGEGFQSIGQALMSIGKFGLDVFTHPAVQAMLDFAAGNPVNAIVTALAAGGVINSVKNIFTSAIVAAFGSNLVATAIGASILAGINLSKEQEETRNELTEQTKVLGSIEGNIRGGQKLLEGADPRVRGLLEKRGNVIEAGRKLAEAELNASGLERLTGSPELYKLREQLKKAEAELEKYALENKITEEENKLVDGITSGSIKVEDVIKKYSEGGRNDYASQMVQNRIRSRITGAVSATNTGMTALSNPLSLLSQAPAVARVANDSTSLGDFSTKMIGMLTEPFAKLAAIPDLQKQVIEYNAKAKEDMEMGKAALIDAANKMVGIIQNGVGNLKVNIGLPGATGGATTHSPTGTSAGEKGGSWFSKAVSAVIKK